MKTLFLPFRSLIHEREALMKNEGLRGMDVVIMSVMAIWLMCTAWIRPLALPDEGRYVGVAWEMLRSGDWMTPTLNGLPYFHKPPMFYWLTTASLDAFGFSEMAARIAPLTGAMLATIAIYYLACRRMSSNAAMHAVLILGTFPMFYGGAQYANHDMLVAGFITATITLGAEAVFRLEEQQPAHRLLLLAWLCAALGVLSKGLIGIVLPAGVLFIWLAIEGRLRLMLDLLWWPALLVFIAVASPWFIAMEQTFPGFVDYFFVGQQFRRFAETGFNNAQPFWFYPAALALLCLPWTPLLIASLRGITTRIRGKEASARRLLWIWIATILLFFSIPSSKLVGYAFPVLPALALLMAEAVLGCSLRVRRYFYAAAGISMLTCVIGVTMIARHDTRSSVALAQVYKGHAAQSDALLVLDWRFDFPVYAGLHSPVPVLHDWRRSELERHDNWAKELADAGAFAPVQARSLLLPADQLKNELCRNAVTWVLAPAGHLPEPLQTAQTMAGTKIDVLLRFEREKNPVVCD